MKKFIILLHSCQDNDNKIYREDGRLLAIGEVDEHGQKQGEYKYFDKDENLFRIFHYKNDSLQGSGVDIDIDGDTLKHYTFENGKAIFILHFDSLGNQIYKEHGVEVYPNTFDTITYGDYSVHLYEIAFLFIQGLEVKI